jgi:F0F1-type ATP synthase membrane subunit c/vacuolar-type H+-ATPase subunit K
MSKEAVAWLGLCLYDPLTGFFSLLALAFAVGAIVGAWLAVSALTVTMSNPASRGELVGYATLIMLFIEAATLWIALRRRN